MTASHRRRPLAPAPELPSAESIRICFSSAFRLFQNSRIPGIHQDLQPAVDRQPAHRRGDREEVGRNIP